MLSHNIDQLKDRITNMGYSVSINNSQCIVKDQGANIIVTTDNEWDSYLKVRDEYVNSKYVKESRTDANI